MKQHLPKMTDLAIFGTLALILAALATTSGSTGAMLGLFAFPIFFASAILGMHRSGRYQPREIPVEVRSEVRRDVRAEHSEG